MPYSTSTDLGISERQLLDLADTNSDGQVESDVIDRAIERADRRIDTYLRGRYVLPFDPAPKEIIEISASLAVYFLSERNDITPSEGLRQRYDDAMKLLKDLQAGRATLDETGQDEGLGRQPGRIVTNKTADDRVFSKDLMSRF